MDLIFFSITTILSLIFILFGFDRRNAAFTGIGGTLLVFTGLMAFSPLYYQQVTASIQAQNGTVMVPVTTMVTVFPVNNTESLFQKAFAIGLVLIGLFSIFIVVDTKRVKEED